jgi:membrane protein DedA with SNARE-associated domain
MRYSQFLAYNVIGGVVWVGLFVWAGYFFGNLPVVRDNFTLVILVIILISVLPIVARSSAGSGASAKFTWTRVPPVNSML